MNNSGNRKIGQIRAYLALSWYSFRAQTRNKSTFAFGFLFPLVFITIFGLIGNSTPKVTIGIPDETSQNNFIIQAIKKPSFVKTDVDTRSSLEEKLKQGKVGGIISVTEKSANPPSYSVEVITSTAIPQEGATVTTLTRDIVNNANLALSGVKNPPVTITQGAISGRQSRYIDFALPGMIGFSLLGTAIFGTVFGIIFLKKSLVLKRMFATPTKPLTILLAQGTSRLIMALLQTLLIIGLGVFVFKFYLPHGIITFIELLLLSALGLVAFLGFGFFMAGLASDENSAGPMVNLITLPQLLLAGTFFPTDNLPSWLQPVATNLPLSYFNIAVRKITTEGKGIEETLPYVAGLLVWSTIMYLLAARTFKWE